MDQPRADQDRPAVDPVVLPDVATQPHPAPHLQPPTAGDPEAGDGALQEVLPEVSAAARKVGGFKRLAEIAGELDRAGSGQ